MTENKKYTAVWFEAFSETNALENELVKLKGLILPIKKAELTHLINIAIGNLRTVREYLITHQANLIKHMAAVNKRQKGG